MKRIKIYFPSSRKKWGPFLTNYSNQFALLGLKYGFAVLVIADTRNRCALGVYLLDGWKSAVDSMFHGSTAVVDNFLTKGNPNGAPMPIPTFPDLGTKPADVPGGIQAFLTAQIDLIIQAPNFDIADLQLLGVVAPTPVPIPIGSAQPPVKAVALPLSNVKITTKRGDFTEVEMQIKRVGDADFSRLTSLFGRTTVVVIPPKTAGLPEKIEIRLWYKKNGVFVGLPSVIVPLVISP